MPRNERGAFLEFYNKEVQEQVNASKQLHGRR